MNIDETGAVLRGDIIERPGHYIGEGWEAIDVIEAWQLGFHLGNAVKYLLRAGRKGDFREDVAKARWYVRRAVTQAGRGAGLLTGPPRSPEIPWPSPHVGDCHRAFQIPVRCPRLDVLSLIMQVAHAPAAEHADILWRAEMVLDRMLARQED